VNLVKILTVSFAMRDSIVLVVIISVTTMNVLRNAHLTPGSGSMEMFLCALIAQNIVLNVMKDCVLNVKQVTLWEMVGVPFK